MPPFGVVVQSVCFCTIFFFFVISNLKSIVAKKLLPSLHRLITPHLVCIPFHPAETTRPLAIYNLEFKFPVQ